MTRAGAVSGALALLLAGCGEPATVVTDAPAPVVAQPAPVRPDPAAPRRERRAESAPAAPLVVHDKAEPPLLPEPDPLEPPPPVPPKPPGAPVTAKDAGDFITAMCEGSDGALWVGTEDHGVLRHAPAAPSPQADDSSSPWTQFMELGGSGGGLPDPHCYALCVDRLGRVWAGRQHSGVSVFNGESWRNYGVLDGPLGERVFDIEDDPVSGDVWIASSRGLARYHLDEDRWSCLTRADGLPSDQMETLAFAPDGTLYAGTQCDGLSVARPADDYATWETTTAPKADRIETEPVGAGLPSDQFNDVLVHTDGTIYAATVRGLARSTDGGGSWTYTRGRDYADKVKRRFEGPPKGWKPWPKEGMEKLLPEDYVTTLSEAPDGRLWIGFRQHGLLLFDPAANATEEVRAQDSDLPEDFVTAAVPTADGAWAGTYGGGLARLDPLAGGAAGPAAAPKRPAVAPHPYPAAPPTAADLEALAASLAPTPETAPETADEDVESEDAEPWGVYLGPDWQTKGDWVGRYGDAFAMLCAMDAPLNHGTASDFRFNVSGHIGRNGRDGDRLRHWVHSKRWDDPRVLYNPLIGYRRQASWDDHAETYPMSHEGPDVWTHVVVPEGLHRVSLYFFNKDGHRGRNRYRDFLLELKSSDGLQARFAPPRERTLERLEASPTLAKARVREFWGGVHHSFAVRGPGRYAVKVGCNDSFNTIVSGVFADQLTGPPNPNKNPYMPHFGRYIYEAPAVGPAYGATQTAALRLVEAADAALVRDGAGAVVEHSSMLQLALRTTDAGRAPDAMLANWRWRLRTWDIYDRLEYGYAMKRGWAAQQDVGGQRRRAAAADPTQK